MDNSTINVNKGVQGQKKNKFKGSAKPVQNSASNPQVVGSATQQPQAQQAQQNKQQAV